MLVFGEKGQRGRGKPGGSKSRRIRADSAIDFDLHCGSRARFVMPAGFNRIRLGGALGGLCDPSNGAERLRRDEFSHYWLVLAKPLSLSVGTAVVQY